MLGGHHYQLQSRLTDQNYHRIIRQLHGKYTAVQQVSDSSYHALRRYGKTILTKRLSAVWVGESVWNLK